MSPRHRVGLAVRVEVSGVRRDMLAAGVLLALIVGGRLMWLALVRA
ncbi:hypothetical protein AERO_10035 [Aeromicrobium fastidiosum]|nr:hypothetical protein [Aeromicrobium fastidiosum]MCL8251722.1 hypothetical protein [Aeromicrobium fastidiosum]